MSMQLHYWSNLIGNKNIIYVQAFTFITIPRTNNKRDCQITTGPFKPTNQVIYVSSSYSTCHITHYNWVLPSPSPPTHWPHGATDTTRGCPLTLDTDPASNEPGTTWGQSHETSDKKSDHINQTRNEDQLPLASGHQQGFNSALSFVLCPNKSTM